MNARIIGSFERAVDALFTYKVFAPRRMFDQICIRANRAFVA
jgi:hypothetical protein